MATFGQWWKSGRDKDPRQITWLCGDEPVLVAHIMDHLLNQLNPAPSNLVGCRAGDMPEPGIWNAIEQDRLEPTTPKVVVVRDAEKLKDLGRLERWLKAKRNAPNTYVIFISNEDDFAKVETEEGGWERAPHLKAISAAKGYAVVCSQFTQTTAPLAVEWVQSMVPMPKNVAGHLLDRADGDLRLARDACVKMRALGDHPTFLLVNQLLPAVPRSSFVDAVCQLDKKTALQRLRDTRRKEYLREVGQLDTRLTLLNQLHHMQARGAVYADMARELGSMAFLIKGNLPVAKHYDDKAVARRRGLLALCDAVLRHRVQTAVMEALVLNW